MLPKLVIFDCDGVLVDSERLTNQVMRDDLATRGLDLPLDHIMELFVGGTIASAGEEAARLGADVPQDWVPMIHDKMFAVLRAEVEIIPGIARVIDDLRAAGIAIAVGSNGPMAKMEITLKKTGLWDKFDGAIYTAHDLDAPKPDPAIYLHAARMAGVDPQDAVVVEDSASGARAAKSAGMRCLGYTADTPKDRLAGIADVLFDDMADLPKLLGL